MWKEASAAAGQGVEGLAMDDVVHVGRSWFRMTSAAATSSGDDDAVVVRSMPVSKTARLGEIVVPAIADDMTARSLFENAFSETAPPGEVIAGKPRRTVTVSLWGFATLGAALLFTGAAVTLMLRPPAAPVAAPVVSAPAPVVTEPVVSAPAPVVAAPVAAAPTPEPPPAPVVVEPLVAPPPPPPSPSSEVVVADESAPVVRQAIARRPPSPPMVPARRLRPTAPAKHEATVTVPDPFAPPPSPAPSAKKPWTDPFAE